MGTFLSQAQETGKQGQTSHGHAISLASTFFSINLHGGSIATITATGLRLCFWKVPTKMQSNYKSIIKQRSTK